MAERDAPPDAEPVTLDYRRRFVRLTGERPNGLVEFDFAIGDPDLFLEMILGREAFAEFCAANDVEVLPPRQMPDVDKGLGPDDWDWRLADATHTRFR